MRPTIGYLDPRFFLTAEARPWFASVGDLRQVELHDAGLASCDVICAFFTKRLDARSLAMATRCGLILHPGSAVLCDVDAASRLGIVVVHFPGMNSLSVAEHTIALVLAWAKGIPESDRLVRVSTDWAAGDRDLTRIELRGKVLGIVGFGRAGRHVARIASEGFGMEVQVWSRAPGPPLDAGYARVEDLDELLRTSDVVSLHVALNDETRGLIDARRVGMLRPSTLLVNTARADLVDCEALRDALIAGRVAGAAFDVWPNDAPEDTFALLDAPNVILTQHNAGLTHEAATRTMRANIETLEAVLRGDLPTAGTVVNPGVWPRRRRLLAAITS